MRFGTSFPLLTKGTPPRCTTRRDILISLPVTLVVPEVAVRDTEIAFETRESFSVVRNLGQTESRRQTQSFQLREYDGALYRRLGRLDELGQDRFNKAFIFPDAAKMNDPETDISVYPTQHGNPITSAIRRQHEWHLEKQSSGPSNVLGAWPQGAVNAREFLRSMNDFQKIAPTVQDMDEELVEMSRRMIDVQAGRLLVIGDELWMGSRPPSWRVQVALEPGSWQDVDVRLDLAVAIEGFDPMLARRHFPLERLDEASAYADRCLASNSTDRHMRYRRRDYVVDYEVGVTELMNFDADGEDLARIGYALAMEIKRASYREHEKVAELGDLRRVLDEAFDVTMETNYVLGEMGDITPHVDDLCAIWKKLSRPISYCESGVSGRRFGDLLLKRAKTLSDNAPISIGLGVSPDRPGMKL
ncbi:hypothetical protein OIU34_24310 [Pararhizobium sp. BT-229]|uniref:hypothetical protein n=1 Tax=Pararhizobium sp. BT-229 TaxID=2986923 RepID=UPI0021F7F503|nr:hypothetical protein [Pararhizobium sp. BT-229]MCV9965024.1 hypothetical protein [Pararhizobium sp. BT-229]